MRAQSTDFRLTKPNIAFLIRHQARRAPRLVKSQERGYSRAFQGNVGKGGFLIWLRALWAGCGGGLGGQLIVIPLLLPLCTHFSLFLVSELWICKYVSLICIVRCRWDETFRGTVWADLSSGWFSFRVESYKVELILVILRLLYGTIWIWVYFE